MVDVNKSLILKPQKIFLFHLPTFLVYVFQVCRELLLLLQLGITEPRQEHAYTAQLQRATDLPAETAHVQVVPIC